jgi:hypothetical protein
MEGKMGRTAYGDKDTPMEHSDRRLKATGGTEGSKQGHVGEEGATDQEGIPDRVFDPLIAGARESGQLTSDEVAAALEGLELDAA